MIWKLRTWLKLGAIVLAMILKPAQFARGQQLEAPEKQGEMNTTQQRPSSRSPDVTEFLQWNFIAGDVSVEQGLIAAAGKFDDDVLYGFLKFGVADQSHVEVAGSLDPMDFSDDHDAMLLECRDDALDGVNHITA